MKRIATIGLLLGCVFTMYGQESSVLDSVVSNIARQLYVFPQEKVYLQTDKPYYINGEKIFFRAFLLDAFSNRQDTLSRYVYVELINPVDSVVQRVKIRKDSTNMFYGAIPLQEELPQGSYRIRAYTQYMCNQGESSFFSKQLQVSDPQILDIQTQSDFQYDEAGKINASLRFLDTKTKDIIQPRSVILRFNQDRQFMGKPDKEGWIRVKLSVPSNTTKRILYAELIDNKHIFRQYIRIPYPKGDFDVTFYPEGGHLIAGQSSNVAFKAVDTNGASLNIKGEIVGSKDNIVAEFKTVHDGMGDFYINSLLDEHYRAICHYGNRTLTFDLPETQKNALALKVTILNDKLLISINKYDSETYPDLYLLIHSRGSIDYAKQWDNSKDFITFDTSIFPSGVSHILLLTKDLQIVSERLVFLLNDDNGFATFQTQKDTYRKREQIQAGIQLKDGNQQALKGNFSIAVTGDKEVVTDSTTSILSDILLRSELRGQIDNPEYYFQKGNKAAETAADLLMKTQGWTRYAIPNVIRGELSYPKISFEGSQEITGTVKSGLRSSLAKNAKVSLLSLNFGYLDFTNTDKNGRYVFQNFEFPDSTKYVIQALNSKGKGKQMTELYLDEDTFPGIHTHWHNSPVIEKQNNPAFLDYVEKADRQYTYENGMRIVNLPEVEVRGINKSAENEKYKSSFYSEPDYSFFENDIHKSGVINIIDLFYRVPGLTVRKDENGYDHISIRGSSFTLNGSINDPLIVIDDIPYISAPDEPALNILKMLNVNDIGRIDVLKNASNTAIYGLRGVNGVIAIHTRRGEMTTPLPTFNIKELMPLGYQSPVEFYSPKYDTQESIDDSKPDLRTTIYWKPNVITDDEGNATLVFYTADDPSTYSVIIEGVSDNGKLIHYRGNASIVVK